MLAGTAGRPGQQHLAAGSDLQRQQRADRNAVAQAGARVARGDAEPLVAGPHVELDALAGRLVQPVEHRPGQAGKVKLRAGRGGQLGQPRAEPESTGRVPGDEPVRLERHQQPVRGRPGQPAGIGQPAQRSRTVGEQVEQRDAAVEHANSGDSAGARLSFAMLSIV